MRGKDSISECPMQEKSVFFSIFFLFPLFGAGFKRIFFFGCSSRRAVFPVRKFRPLFFNLGSSCAWRGCKVCKRAGGRMRVRMRACARVRVCVCVSAHYASVENCPLGVRRKLPVPMMGSSKIALYMRVENCMRPIRVRRKCAYTGVTKIASAYECALENQAYTCASKIDFFYFSKAKF